MAFKTRLLNMLNYRQLIYYSGENIFVQHVREMYTGYNTNPLKFTAVFSEKRCPSGSQVKVFPEEQINPLLHKLLPLELYFSLGI